MDEFLFDEDLLQEGLLSREDAWAMYERGELEEKVLFDYLAYQRFRETNKTQGSNPFLAVAVIIFSILCLLSCALIASY